MPDVKNKDFMIEEGEYFNIRERQDYMLGKGEQLKISVYAKMFSLIHSFKHVKRILFSY